MVKLGIFPTIDLATWWFQSFSTICSMNPVKPRFLGWFKQQISIAILRSAGNGRSSSSLRRQRQGHFGSHGQGDEASQGSSNMRMAIDCYYEKKTATSWS